MIEEGWLLSGNELAGDIEHVDNINSVEPFETY
jgi:hypothetical protein